MREVAQVLVDAISVGGLYALTALGIGMIFGVMRLVNFAHADLITFAGYAILMFFAQSTMLAIVAAVIAAIVLALITERAAFRPLRGANPETLLVSSFAVSFFLEKTLIMVVGARPKGVDFLPGLARQVDVAGVRLQLLHLVTIAISLALLAGTTWLLRATRLGLEMRAAAENFRMAEALGVRANRVIAAAFAISGLLAAAVACMIVAQTGLVQPRMGLQLVVIAFVGTVIGGLGSLPGAAIGGFLVGVGSILAAGPAARGAPAIPGGVRLCRCRARPDCSSARPLSLTQHAATHMRSAMRERAARLAPLVLLVALVILVAVRCGLRADHSSTTRDAGPYHAGRRRRPLCFCRQLGGVLFWQRRVHGDRRLCVGAPDDGSRPEVGLSARSAEPSGRAILASACGRSRRRSGSGRDRRARWLSAHAPLRHFGEHRHVLDSGRRVCRARQLDLGYRRPELAHGAAQLCRPLDRGDLGRRRHRNRLRLSGIARRIAAARLARGRSRGEGRWRRHCAPSLDRLHAQRLLERRLRCAARAFSRYGSGRDLLSRPDLPHHRDAGDRRGGQPDWRGCRHADDIRCSQKSCAKRK